MMGSGSWVYSNPKYTTRRVYSILRLEGIFKFGLGSLSVAQCSKICKKKCNFGKCCLLFVSTLQLWIKSTFLFLNFRETNFRQKIFFRESTVCSQQFTDVIDKYLCFVYMSWYLAWHIRRSLIDRKIITGREAFIFV